MIIQLSDFNSLSKHTQRESSNKIIVINVRLINIFDILIFVNVNNTFKSFIRNLCEDSSTSLRICG